VCAICLIFEPHGAPCNDIGVEHMRHAACSESWCPAHSAGTLFTIYVWYVSVGSWYGLHIPEEVLR
jgi:hypothetical protein